MLCVLLFVCYVYTFVALFSISLHALGYRENIGTQVLLVFTYVLDIVLVGDFILRFNIASETITELKDIRESYKWSLLFWIDLLAILPIEILATTETIFHKRWHLFAFLRLNRLFKAVRISIPRFFTNLENNLKYSIGKVRAIKFTIYIILTTHISPCVWFWTPVLTKRWNFSENESRARIHGRAKPEPGVNHSYRELSGDVVESQKRRSHPGGKTPIGDMPLSLQEDVTYEESRDFLEKVPIFMETGARFLR